MPTFDSFTIEDARLILGSLNDADAEVAQAYFNGDAWQAGNAWIGPRPAVDAEGADDVLEEIERGLVSKNVVAEVVHRHSNALIGQEPDWSLTVRRPMKADERPTQEEQKLIDEAEAALTEWWDSREVLSFLQRAVGNLLTNSYEESRRSFTALSVQSLQPGAARPRTNSAPVKRARATMRLFVPATFLTKDSTIPPQSTIAAALGLIYPHAPDQFTSTVYVDSDSQERIAVYGFTARDQLNLTTENRAEIHGLDRSKRTTIKLFSDVEEIGATQPLELAGNLGIFEMRRERFITPQIAQLQALVNMALTMMGRNVVLGGFLERILLNAQLPGEWIDDPGNAGKKIFQPNPFYVGAGSTNALSGLPIYGDNSRPSVITGYATPNVVYRDPVSVQTFTDTLTEAYHAILDEVGQTHALISKDATASGESRKQAAAEFLKTLNSTKTQVEAAGRWILETALSMAAQLAGQPGRFKDLRATFQCRVDIGPITAEEEKSAILLKDAGIIDVTTAMARVGVDDVDAEQMKITERKAEEAKLNPNLPTNPADPNNPPQPPK